MRSFYGLVAVAGAFVAFGCGSEATFGDAGGGGSSSTTASGGTSSVGGAGTGAGETGGMAGTGGMGTGGSPPLGDPIEAPDMTWTWVDFPEAKCRNGSNTGIGVNLNSGSDKVMIFLQGGGACFNGISCGTNPSSYGENDFGSGPSGGVFDRGNMQNPVADWSFIFVPYCTGDVHAGDNPGTMVPNVGTQDFVGYSNMTKYLERIVPTFPAATQVLLTGVSAGGFGAAANTDQVRRYFGNIPVTLIDDSGPPFSGEYAAPCLQQQWANLWGLDKTLIADCGASCPDPSNFLIDYALYLGDTYPNEPAGLISSQGDNVIRTFLAFGENNCNAGFYSTQKYAEGLDDLKSQVDENVFGTYYIQGTQHTWIGGGSFYNTTVNGVPLTQWFADVLAGNPAHVAP
ncbi:MAG: hypothetical protein KC731_11280 [Myxococcales bacterium]|nr:hypothetical protein [Myxococcales bacterium]